MKQVQKADDKFLTLLILAGIIFIIFYVFGVPVK